MDAARTLHQQTLLREAREACARARQTIKRAKAAILLVRKMQDERRARALDHAELLGTPMP